MRTATAILLGCLIMATGCATKPPGQLSPGAAPAPSTAATGLPDSRPDENPGESGVIHELDGDRLTFKQVALPRMACPDMEYEAQFANALMATTNWKISDSHLELSDATGRVLAHFESRNL